MIFTTIILGGGVVAALRSPPPRSPGVLQSATTIDATTACGGGERIAAALKAKGRASLVGYLTCGYPSADETAGLMVSLEDGGCDVIELGVPFTDPMADGATIQACNEVALEQGVGLAECLETVRAARTRGLEAPVVLMGYYNPFRAYGVDKLATDARDAGVDGLIVVDLPPEEARIDGVLEACASAGLGLVPLVAPTTTDARLEVLAEAARRTGGSMLYCVSVLGVTGGDAATADELGPFLSRVKAAAAEVPLAVGFGISTPANVKAVADLGADGVVVGSAIIRALDARPDPESRADGLRAFARSLRDATTRDADNLATYDFDPLVDDEDEGATTSSTMPDHFGSFGGRYIPETLAAAHQELEREYARARQDPAFLDEIDFYRRQFVGGPTPLYHATRLTEDVGGAQIWLKREELAHTGAHKINNAIGQALLAKRLGKTRIIAETGAGQHGVATATVCALLGLDCVVYMGAVDCARQSLNVFRMNVLGARVVPVRSGEATLKDAINEAMRDWVTNVRDTHYLIGSAIGPHPFPTIVRDFQAVIGREARDQFQRANNDKLPDAVVACVGGGSNAIGMFHEFVPFDSVQLHGAEADGDSVQGSATLSRGSPGVLHGTRTYLLQDAATGQVEATHSISAGLDYPGVGPEHAFLKDAGRAVYHPITNDEALDAFSRLARSEGIIPALEPSHAVALAIKLAKDMPSDAAVLVNLCGRGDKDMITVAKALSVDLDDYTPTDGKWESFTDRIGRKH